MSETDAARLRRDLDTQVARENIAWWEAMRQDHLQKGQTIAARKCQEEIGLWRQEIEDISDERA
jgi:hypothetical protein